MVHCESRATSCGWGDLSNTLENPPVFRVGFNGDRASLQNAPTVIGVGVADSPPSPVPNRPHRFLRAVPFVSERFPVFCFGPGSATAAVCRCRLEVFTTAISVEVGTSSSVAVGSGLVGGRLLLMRLARSTSNASLRLYWQSRGLRPSEETVTKPLYVALQRASPSCTYSMRSSSAFPVFHICSSAAPGTTTMPSSEGRVNRKIRANSRGSGRAVYLIFSTWTPSAS